MAYVPVGGNLKWAFMVTATALLISVFQFMPAKAGMIGTLDGAQAPEALGPLDNPDPVLLALPQTGRLLIANILTTDTNWLNDFAARLPDLMVVVGNDGLLKPAPLMGERDLLSDDDRHKKRQLRHSTRSLRASNQSPQILAQMGTPSL